MNAHYTVQVSNHPGAGSRIPTEEASKSWETKYDGSIATSSEARQLTEQLSKFYRNVRTFKGCQIGKLWYAVLR
jgi:hypothetical protein